MQWRERIDSVCPECLFQPPAGEASISDVEAALSLQVPQELRALWLEANGITDRYGDGIWSSQHVIEQNLEMRSYPDQNDLYMSFESLFCFADAGNGDVFFFPIQADGKINRPDVFIWNHETDSREWAAANLERFVEVWFSGKWCEENS